MTRPASEALAPDPDALREQCAAFLLRSARPDRDRLLGLEYECLRVRRAGEGAAPSLGPDGPDSLLHALGRAYQRSDDEPLAKMEGGILAALHADLCELSIEPGGQVEVALPPLRSPIEVRDRLVRHQSLLEYAHAGSEFRPLFLGHQPVTEPGEIELRAKPRYGIMDRRLRRAGTLGVHMMRATAGMQITVDFRDEAECVGLLRASLLAAPFLTALYANSRRALGVDTGYRSYREHVWWNTDSSRCGVPVRLLREDAAIADYVDFALDAVVWFVERGGELVEVEGRHSLREVHGAGEKLTLSDFALHCSTLFPAARLRSGVELRSADCVPLHAATSFAALVAGILYDEEARSALADLHPYRSAGEVRAFHELVARDGICARDARVDVQHACHALIAHARAGVGRLAAAGRFEPEVSLLLDPLDRVVDEECGRGLAGRAGEARA